MSFSYDLAKVSTEALHAVRALIGDVQQDRPQLEDQEIELRLLTRGLTLTSDPTANWTGVIWVAAECCQMIAARLSSESEIVVSDVGQTKRSAAQEYRMRYLELRDAAVTGATPRFADPAAYPVVHVTGVDALPELES